MSDTVYFLSDIHLSEKTPDITRAFLETMHALEVDKPQGVFILGDLFERWLGDKMVDDFARYIAENLAKLAKICPVFFQRGNRDFLLGGRYCVQSGMTLLPDIYQFSLNEHRILIEHGDLLCSDDVDYQKLRKVLRHPYFYRFAELTPRWLSCWIGSRLRKSSCRAKKRLPKAKMDVHDGTVIQRMQTHTASILIHGHTHCPAVHLLGAKQTRYVLGDWHPEGQLLYYSADRFELVDSRALRKKLLEE